ncbi:hypothetical protein CNE_1c12070 [Cupriavidus necator N-1]|uniref:Uncharacterized protein n=2 Tax=Cupriavidus necator TaxID=106590 RepID=G0ER44_CUPNN|nr:hypothetical protein CNE_1c12070 [Cupriavidus necator N-1]
MPDNSHAAWREVRILVDFYRRGDHRNGSTGIFSPKFGLKTKVSGEQFLQFVREQRDADVWIINPFPTIAYYSYNVWMQGEINHPGLTERAQGLLDSCGIGWDLARVPRQTNAVLCYSNFWVGTSAFWEGYVGGVLDPIARYLEASPDTPVAKAVMGDTWHTDAAPFLPFIVERLFSTYLSLQPSVRIASYPIESILDYCLTDFERELVERMRPSVDAADRAGAFPKELAEMQGLLCSLYKRYAIEHFAVNAHPHSGKTVAA